MALCKKCGVEVADGIASCPNCGEEMVAEQAIPQQETQVQNGYAPSQPYYQQPMYEGNPPSGQMNTGLLVWSIINTVACCQILGIIALIFTITAKSSPTLEEEQKKLKTVKTLNLIGTIGGAILMIGYVALLASGLLGEFANMGMDI